MANELDSSIGVVHLRARHDLMVGEAVLLLDRVALRGPFLSHLVEVFVVVDGDGVVDIVADSFAASVTEFLLFCGFLLNLFLLLLEFGFLCEEFGRVLLVLLVLKLGRRLQCWSYTPSSADRSPSAFC